MASRWHVELRDGMRLACLEHHGPAPGVILLHGLAGYAGEWAETASWLTKIARIVAVEQRAHGRSERAPADISPDAFVADAEMWIERLGLAPAVVVGQSLGGLVSILLAARRPEVVRALVVVEATPAADREAVGRLRLWLESWPVPFATREEALVFFGGDTGSARAWVAGLEDRDDGLWPGFDREVLLGVLGEASRRDWWDEWTRIRCPVLVVRGAHGADPSETALMAEMLSAARLVEIEDAGHDLHLEQPLRWRNTLEAFLHSLDR